MFTLSGLILEARENLFRDFWSPFSISFYFSSVLGQDTAGRGFISRRPGPRESPAAQPQHPNPSRASIRAPLPAAAGAAATADPPPEVASIRAPFF